MSNAHLLQLALGFGVVTGGIIALSAVGLSLQFGITNYVNFAFGELLTIGAYMTLLASRWIGQFWLAALIGIGVTAVFGVMINRVLLQRFVDRRSSTLTMLIVTFALSLILQSTIQGIWGADYQRFDVPRITTTVNVVGFLFTTRQLMMLAVAGVAMVGLHLLLTRTRLGRAMRATSDNSELARVSGIRHKRISDWTWLLASGLAGLSGVFLALTISSFTPYFGFQALFLVFAAVILGGIGRPYGAVAGAMVIGVAIEVSAVIVSPAYKDAVAFLIAIAVLLVRPNGLFNVRGKN